MPQIYRFSKIRHLLITRSYENGNILEYVINPRMQAAAVDGATAGVVVEVPSVDLASDILTIKATTISEFL